MGHLHELCAVVVVASQIAMITSCNLGGDYVECNTNLVAGLRVTVVNGVGTDGQCDVVVRAVDGAYSEDLQCHAESPLCKCWGAQERPGTYEITATRADGATATQTVSVGKGPCGVEPKFVTLTLP